MRTCVILTDALASSSPQVAQATPPSTTAVHYTDATRALMFWRKVPVSALATGADASFALRALCVRARFEST